MKKLLLLSTFLVFTCATAQTVFTDGDHTFIVDDVTFVTYLYETTATGDVTFPETALQGGFIPRNISGVDANFISFGAGITSATFPASYKVFAASSLRGLADVVTVTFVGGEDFGGKLLRNAKNLTTVDLPTTITAWGTEMFSQSGLTTINLGNCPEINNRMFRDCPITELTVPASVTAFSAAAWNNSSIVKLIMEGDTPPTIAADWEGTAANITAYVPTAAVATYQAAPIWADMDIRDITTLGVQSLEALEASVYPNPTTGKVFVQTKQQKPLDLAVFDINGRNLMSVRGNEINISSLSQGVYILKGKTEDGEFAQRIVKQ